jgi:acyl-coenzyme A synthetase/AMP-(fatty) acid ligase
VPDHVALFPMELARWIDARAISVWYSVPSALTRLLLHGRMERFTYRAVRAVLFAGEVFPVKYLRGVMERLPQAEFFNLYGPTETNVCTYYRLPRPLDEAVSQLPIGGACENTCVFALDDAGRLVDPGGTGELYVRGPTVMCGYWGMPDRSREVLQPNPLQTAFSERVYRTGDTVRREADGTYRFVGRRDHMVKSRGYRVELGEIEEVLQRCGAVREAVALAIPDEEIGNRIEAVVVLNPGHAPCEAELQTFCAAYLPRYMVPERFTFRSELPLTSTGKVDRVGLLGERSAAGREGRSA